MNSTEAGLRPATQRYVVTTSIRGSSKTQIWESDRPLGLGHPLRFVLERWPGGVRIRDLSTALDRIESGRAHEIPDEKLARGAEIDIQGFSFKIRAARLASPAYETSTQGSDMRIYHCAGKWILDSRTIGNSFTAEHRKQPIFRISRSGDLFSLRAKSAGVKLASRGEIRSLSPDEAFELSAKDLTGATLSFATANAASILTWKFGLAQVPELMDRAPRTLDLEEARAFRKSLRYAAIGFAVFMLMSWLWPKPKEDPKELIPPQFTKIVLTQPRQSSAPESAEMGGPSKLPKKVQDAAVVQAFRAKALSNAVNGLLKGGMSRLLAQSDFVAGTRQSMEARRIFDSKSDALKATAPVTGLQASHDVKVASLGGGNGAGGSAVGYGKGEHAGVKGQGKGLVPFVTADESGSVVDEGLTKDEVGEVIHRHLSEIRYCYESAMVRTPDIEGKLVTNFTIGKNGAVRSADVKSSTLPDPRLDDCIVRRLTTWQFPKPRGGVDVSVSYPFIFKTLGR